MKIKDFVIKMLSLDYKSKEWSDFNKIKSINFKSGDVIYPDWQHIKFLYYKKHLYIKYGTSEAYGARITNNLFSISSDKSRISFTKINGGISSNGSTFYDTFRKPKANDILQPLSNEHTVLEEGYIRNVTSDMNYEIIELWMPLKYSPIAFSYYDQAIYRKDIENCMHGSLYNGIYMHFVANPSKKKIKNLGIYHKAIRIESIKDITLKV